MTTYTGVLHFYSETGTEGGYWAMQDERFMGLIDEATMNTYRCTRCGRIWDKTTTSEEPTNDYVYWHGSWSSGGGGYRGQEEWDPDGDAGPDGDWNVRRNQIARQCNEEGHLKWELLHPNGTWSYEGLHVMKNGDKLTIFDPKDKDKVLWSGEVMLEEQPLFTTDIGNLWVHSVPTNFPREEWMKMFVMEWPCRLETTEGGTT